ncbi:MAG: hypothetical protein KGI75_17190 [Rhizobiaceae bacterium]|nr:hypothetical protein [Rhizobiaceae bacterium]
MTSIRNIDAKQPLPATDARQGARGTGLLTILIAALVLAAIGWAAAEMWGRYLDPNKGVTSSSPAAPSSTTIPPGSVTSGQALPPSATDKSDNNQLGIKSTPAQPSRDGTQN